MTTKSIDIAKSIISNSHTDELRGGQRTAYVLLKLLSGTPLIVAELAAEMGQGRQNVYRILRDLSGMHVPVVNYPFGSWTLLQFVPEPDKDTDDDVHRALQPSSPHSANSRESFVDNRLGDLGSKPRGSARRPL